MLTKKSWAFFFFAVQNGDMFSVMMNDEYILSKAGVIEFFASDKAFRIYNKSKWHEKAVEYLWERLG